MDFDSTDDPGHGNQVGRFYHGYYKGYCFLPLCVFCGKHLLAGYLKPISIDAAHCEWSILKLLKTQFREVWPDVKIIFRADSWKYERRIVANAEYSARGEAENRTKSLNGVLFSEL